MNVEQIKNLLQSIDRTLGVIAVSGDSVLLLADARRALAELWRMLNEKEEKAE